MNIISLLNSREIKLTGPFPPGQVMLERLAAKEWVGQPFDFKLEVVSAIPWLDYETFLGKPMTVELETGEGQTRYFNGYVERFAQAGRAGDNIRFQIWLRPWLWLLRHTSNSRIFQDKTVVEVIEQIFGEHGFPFDKKLSGSYKKWEYIAQYRESDYNFVSRLMEQEGLYYYFSHDAQKHTLILADPPNALPALRGYEEVPLYPPAEGQQRKRDHLDSWTHSWRVVPGGYATRDFDFKNPKGDLHVVLQNAKPHPYSQFEVYDYPGEYVQRADGEQHVRKQLEVHQSPHARVEAAGTARGMMAGSVFRVLDFDFGGGADVKKQYMVLQTSYTITLNSYGSGASGPELDCRCSIVALDSEVNFRTPTQTDKPVVSGPQTATVVGKAGEEIWTDKYGRVKVQFHWDREGKSDENSSCWVRVSQAWAGGGWGSMHIPRIGQEVIVDFLEGDPDRPIITGRVYNGDNMPPYDLPANQTRSGIKSRSTKGGTADNANEIRFEDKKGQEELYLQAEKDQNTLVKNNQTLTVKANRTVSVGGDEAITVTGNETVSVKKTRTTTIDQTDAHTVVQKLTETYKGGRQTDVEQFDNTTVIGANKNIQVDKQYNLEADEHVSIVQKQNQILVKDQVYVESIGDIQLKNPGCQVQAVSAGTLTLKAMQQIQLQCGAASIILNVDGSIVISGVTGVQVASGPSLVKVGPEGSTVAGPKVGINGMTLAEMAAPIVKVG